MYLLKYRKMKYYKNVTYTESYKCFLATNSIYYYVLEPYAVGDNVYTNSSNNKVLATDIRQLTKNVSYSIKTINADGTIVVAMLGGILGKDCSPVTSGDLTGTKTERVESNQDDYDTSVKVGEYYYRLRTDIPEVTYVCGRASTSSGDFYGYAKVPFKVGDYIYTSSDGNARVTTVKALVKSTTIKITECDEDSFVTQGMIIDGSSHTIGYNAYPDGNLTDTMGHSYLLRRK